MYTVPAAAALSARSKPSAFPKAMATSISSKWASLLRPLRLDYRPRASRVELGHVGARTVGLAQGGQHFGGGQVVVGSQLGGCGVGVQLGRRGGQLVTTAVYLLQAWCCPMRFDTGVKVSTVMTCGGRTSVGTVKCSGAVLAVAHLAAVAKHAFDEQRRQVGRCSDDFGSTRSACWAPRSLSDVP